MHGRKYKERTGSYETKEKRPGEKKEVSSLDERKGGGEDNQSQKGEGRDRGGC